jgi:hypothetical protein
MRQRPILARLLASPGPPRAAKRTTGTRASINASDALIVVVVGKCLVNAVAGDLVKITPVTYQEYAAWSDDKFRVATTLSG